MDIAGTLAVGISVLALILSGITFWNNSLKPFRLRVSNAGRIELLMNPYRIPSLEPGLMLELIFANDGASPGLMQDVAIVVTFPNEQHVLFRSMVLSVDQTHSRSYGPY